MDKIYMYCEKKKVNSKIWERTYYSDNKEHILEMFASDMTYKYIYKSKAIGTIKRKHDYSTGYNTYTVNRIDNETDTKYRTIYYINI